MSYNASISTASHQPSSEHEYHTIENFKFNKKCKFDKGSDGVYVYRGLNATNNTHVAIKCIKKRMLSNQDEIMKKNLRHENLAPFLAKLEEGPFVYFIMELCAGNLDDIINAKYKGPLPGDMIEILRQTAFGLQYLHLKIIIHGNLKPQNILISLPGENGATPKVKLTDFGIRKSSQALAAMGWTAPECHESAILSQDGTSTDIFALGCVFGYTLTEGGHPFGEEDIRDDNISEGRISWIEGRKRIEDGNLKGLIESMVSYEPRNRPSITAILEHRIFFGGSTSKFNGRNIIHKIPTDGTQIGEMASSGVKIYKATVNALPRAVKRIDKRNYAINYKKEIEILTRPEMSNCLYLVRYFCHEEDDNYCYIEMELCAGSLYSFVLEKRLSSGFGDNAMKKRIFQKNIIEGLAFLHDNVNMIHRDIKPSNILIFEHRNVLVPKIADYGISEIGEGNETVMFRGTEGWKAPELKSRDFYSKAAYTKAVDIFAAGCLLFYIETDGGHPFSELWSPNIGKEAQRNIEQFKPRLTSLSLIEPTLLDLLCHTLEREPQNRLSACKMLEHPAFFSYEESLNYLRKASEHNNDLEKKFDKYLLPNFKLVIINDDWRGVLEKEVLEEAKYSGPQPSGSQGKRSVNKKFEDSNYGKSVYNLILLIRNKYAHYYDISEGAKQIMGEIPNKYIEYWHKKFPHLLISTWNVCSNSPRTPDMLKEIQKILILQHDKQRRNQAEGKSGFSSFFSKIGGFFSFGNKEVHDVDHYASVQTRPAFRRPYDVNKKSSFFDFLTDYAKLESSSKELRPTEDLEMSKKAITHRLRHRIDLTVAEDDSDYVSVTQNAIPSSSAYDTLLELIDDYDPSGVCEIYQLLFEAKFTAPLLNPLTYQHYLLLFKEVYANVVPNEPAIRLGENTSLSRVMFISCRKRTETQSLELLRGLFNLETFHRNDLFNSTFTHQTFTIDLGIGYVGRKAQNPANTQENHHVLVVHVFGFFEGVMGFANEFADILLVEDVASDDRSSETFGSYFRSGRYVTCADDGPQILLWKPTSGQVSVSPPEEALDIHKFLHTRVSSQFGDKLVGKLAFILKEMFRKRRSARKGLSQLCLLDNESSPFASNILSLDIVERLRKLMPKVAAARASLVLQQNFCEQAVYEEKKREYRLREDQFKMAEEKIEECRKKRMADASRVSDVPVLRYFLEWLRHPEKRIRVIALRQFGQELGCLTDRELEKQQSEINQLYQLLIKNDGHMSSEKNSASNEIKKKYVQEKLKYRESMLHVEHLWRELSHLYVANPRQYADFPRLAAQHMFDGFCIELLDGDANLVNLVWIKAILSELKFVMGHKKNRIFVLSVMGVQSSGKSTLLNTMFGIKMRTSVGQCTRGINMQLVPVEGRTEYDYVLILDTEGTRSPEHWGMPGNEKRDNQMATLSILLADATIIVNPGENDAAVKEILPIVLMAYRSSRLAEDTCGRLSSMMFFVYNRIDTTQREKLSNIIQTLSDSLKDAFTIVQQKAGYKPNDLDANQLFRHFVLDASNSAESDVRILGQNKKSFVPPENVPDSAYGETLVEFREHIHKRVTRLRNGVKWQSHSSDELSKYLEDIWECICSADFNLQFTHVVERVAFDQLEAQYQKIERKFISQYEKHYADIRRSMLKEALSSSRNQMDATQSREYCETLQETLSTNMGKIISKLDKDFAATTNDKGRERWRLSYEHRWQMCKSKQEELWRRQLHQSYDTIFRYYNQLETFKNKLRQSINKGFRGGLFARITGQLRNQFDELMKQFIDEAEETYPSVNIRENINTFYSESTIIKSHQILLSEEAYEKACNKMIQQLLTTNIKIDDIKKLILKEVREFWLAKGKSKEGEHSRNTNQQIAGCLITIEQNISKYISGAQCYNDGIVSETIHNTDVVLQESGLNRIDYSHRQMAHTFARLLLISRMEEVQRNWEANNSIPAKLKHEKTVEAMWQYFQMVSGGAKKITLFGLLVKEKFENLQESYKAEVVAITVKRIRENNLLINVRRIQCKVELYLAELVKRNRVPEIVSYVQFPNDLVSTVIYSLVAGMVKHITFKEKKWEQYVVDLKGAVNYATRCATGGKQNRASRFLKALTDCLEKSLVSERLIQSLGTSVGSEYMELDNEGSDAFRKEVQKVLEEALRKESPPADMEEFNSQVTALVVENLQRKSGSSELLWCNHCCPWCGSLCNREAGHIVSNFKHDTIHQPAGLVGHEFKSLKILEPRPCSDFYNDESFLGKTIDDEEVSFDFRDWCTVFPDWEKPKHIQRNFLREYIFYHYHAEFAKCYGFDISPDVPAKYNQDLNSIIHSLEWDSK